jgi:hypothetical protein
VLGDRGAHAAGRLALRRLLWSRLPGLGIAVAPARATKLLQINQFDLKRYYDQTLRQGNQIFYVGLICILLGFAVIGVAFWLIQSGRVGGLSNKIVVAALGAIGGALANFIAVIYLRMFSETIKSVGQFHERLVMRDRLNFGNILAAKITTDELREKTLAGMATQLACLREEELRAATATAGQRAANGASSSGPDQ